MNLVSRFICLTLLSLCVGCSTVVVDRASGAALTGKAYTKVLTSVNNLALDKALDFGATFLATTTDRSAGVLDQITVQHKTRVRTVAESNASLDMLASYFAGLEALSKGEASEATENALATFSNALKEEPFGIKVSDDRRAALTGLAGFVSKQHHTAEVERALRRDADTVARSIALSDEILSTVGRWVAAQEGLEAKRSFQNSVEAPFTSGAPLDANWQVAWKSHVRGPALIAVLKEARMASADMQRAWISVLSGQYSFEEVLASLKNVQSGVDALSALAKSN